MIKKSMVISAQITNWHRLYNLLSEFMMGNAISSDVINNIIVASEEIFVNISHYAYPNSSGDVRVDVEYVPVMNCVRVKFTDSGVPFDPTSIAKPNVKEKIENRKIGGLGIFIVNRLMDSMEYSHNGGKNNLVITKKTK